MLGAVQSVSDNGYLDVMLQFGLVGVGMLVVLLMVCLRDFLRLLRRSAVPLVAYWYAGLILAVFVGGFTTSLFWDLPGQIITFMFVLAYAGLRNLSHERRGAF
jgi:O-antigen ligase